MSLASTSEFVADPVPPIVPKNEWHLPWDFFPYRDISTADSLLDSNPFESLFRPQRSSRSRRFAPRGALQVYFTPQPRVGFTLQGLSLLPSRCFSSKRRALLPFPGSILLVAEASNAGSSHPAFRALIRAAIRDHRQGY